MTPKLSSWQSAGDYINYGPFQHKMFVRQLGQPEASSEKTLLLIHGFPESSYSYHKVVEGLLSIFDRIVLFDMLGYGFSDKPTKNFTYSLFEQADTVFAVWKHFGIKGGHVLAHDMGDSVLTEIVARHQNNLLPAWFSDGLLSLTFTNGSMVLELASLRITQRIMLSSYGHLLKNAISFRVGSQQIRSAQGNDNLSEQDIRDFWELNSQQEGNKKFYLTIRYLNDRKRFEKTRWLPALSQCSLPIHICWGEDDAVARVEMAYYLKKNICLDATLTIMKGLGHFCQMGSPEKWLKHIGAFYAQV